MALITLGTAATTSLHAIPQGTEQLAADVATFRANVKDDLNNIHPIVPFAYSGWSGHGTLFIPNRGVLRVLPGDYVAYDANGWPILVSAHSIATGGWTHS